jgi:hypothetical protein
MGGIYTSCLHVILPTCILHLSVSHASVSDGQFVRLFVGDVRLNAYTGTLPAMQSAETYCDDPCLVCVLCTIRLD